MNADERPLTVLRVDASMNRRNATSRQLTDAVLRRLGRDRELNVIVRDLAEGVPFIDEAWIDANFTDPAERSPSQREALAVSDTLVGELKQAEVLVLGVPIYNLGPPAAFKAWIDQVARARETFRYSSRGPKGLLDITKAYLIVSSGGTPVGGKHDYVTGYTCEILRFLGIKDIEVLSCDGLMMEGEELVEQVLARIESLA